MACLFSMRFGLSAGITHIAGSGLGAGTDEQQSGISLSTHRLLTWASYWQDSLAWVCQSFYTVDQGSKRECSKRQEMEDASLLRPESRSFKSHSCAIYC